jgi:hypothetical protein
VRSTIRTASSSGAAAAERRSRPQRSSSRWTGKPAQLVAEAFWGGHDHAAQPHERFADIDGAAAGDQQQPQRFPPRTRARQRERLAGKRRPRRWDRVERVILAAPPMPVSRPAADLEHGFAALAEIAGKPEAVISSTFDRPRSRAGRVPLGETKRLPGATHSRSQRLLGNDSTGRRCQHRQNMLVTVGVDADHLVQFVCKHPHRSSDLARWVAAVPV